MRNEALLRNLRAERDQLFERLAPLEQRQLIAGGVPGNEARICDIRRHIDQLSHLIQTEENRDD